MTELSPTGPSGPMCPEWEHLAARHGCRRFAAVSITAAGARIGVLTLASRSSASPAWSPDALRSVAALLTVHTKRAAALLAEVLPALVAAETVSQLVYGLGLVAAQVAAQAAHVEAGVRVALLQPGAEVAAVFPLDMAAAASAMGGGVGGDITTMQNTTTSLRSVRMRRASCELVMSSDLRLPTLQSNCITDNGALLRQKFSTDGSRPPTVAGLPLPALAVAPGTVGAQAGAATGPAAAPAAAAGANTAALTTPSGRVKRIVCFAKPSAPVGGDAAMCRGHAVRLASTLLAEALSKGAAGLCVGDCAAHVQDRRAFPRDLVLTRTGVMPAALALATSGGGASSAAAAARETAAAAAAAAMNSSGIGLTMFSTAGSSVSGGANAITTGGPATSTATANAVGFISTLDAAGTDPSVRKRTPPSPARQRPPQRPMLALYLTFGSAMPSSLLQAIVHAEREVLLALTPLVAAKASGVGAGAGPGGGGGGLDAMAAEWEVLQAELKGVMRRKGSLGAGADSTASNVIRAVNPSSVLVEDTDVFSPGSSRTPPGTGSQLRVLDGAVAPASLAAGGAGAGAGAGGGGGPEGSANGRRTSRLSGNDYQRLNMSPARLGSVEAAASPFNGAAATSAAAVSGAGGGTGPSSMAGARVVNPTFMRLSQADNNAGGGTGGTGGGGTLSGGRPRSIGAAGAPRTGSFIKRIIGLGGGGSNAGGGGAAADGRLSMQGVPFDASLAGAGGIGESLPGTNTHTGTQPSTGMLVDVPTGGSDGGYLASVVTIGSTAGYGSGGGGGGQTAQAYSSGGAAGSRRGHHAPARSVSFRLEAARSPRGVSKLAPIIGLMHERLKAAQAVQMTGQAGAGVGGAPGDVSGAHAAAISRQAADLESVRMLQEIGKGGYGTVYRGTYHGAEVAIKVIQEAKWAANAAAAAKKEARGKKPGAGAGAGAAAAAKGDHAATAGGANGGSHTGSAEHSPTGSGNNGAPAELHKHNIHDAIELVASVSISHPNIVQVLTFFTDCVLVRAGEGGVNPELLETLFSSSGAAASTAAAALPASATDITDVPAHELRLVPAPPLLDSPAPGTDGPGPSSMALVMEFCDAGSLCEAIVRRVFLRQLKPTDPNARPAKPQMAICMRSVFATLLEVALALRHMHSLHLVHCDLKPQNVLLKSNPRDLRGFTAKLSDFGLSKVMAHDDVTGQLVIDDAVGSGTITHVAPEVLLGKRHVGAAVDIYAFGILMYQVLCGMHLYQGLTPQQVANGVAHDGLRPVLPAWVPASYRALAERCWHAAADARPTADELVRQLEKLSTGGLGGGGAARAASSAAQQGQPQGQAQQAQQAQQPVRQPQSSYQNFAT
ncbi:hypothetical protein HYH02_013244 [Chlamydomonas schloesseri]|uniref:Protein kinase domain-containing protein n=1 Tax=Chlamydomonas schloesseri TaxID=2026947 RepID=A0A835VW79_9CHLO|nr:hypothetical protein HYH02_013244 [Chlamydomonas schloesseri]|eukprot:KAG2431667.1 hypothetical protein HYH02_013244 [Chlamydomonas schloesseri]